MVTRLAAVLLAAAWLVACKSEAPAQTQPLEPPSEKNAAQPTAVPTSSVADLPEPAAEQGESPAATEKQLAEGKIVAVSLLSPRSFSLKLRLEGGNRAAFKPLRKGDHRAPFEVAAYRIASLLMIEQMPTSTLRRIPAAFLTGRLEKDNPETARGFEEAAVIDDRGFVNGAMIEWMETIDREGLKTLGGIPAINGMLRPGRPAEGDEPLAVAASNMVVFDHIIGNWDRFSGGNFYLSKDGRHLVLIDHNGSFTPWPEKRADKMEKRLAMTERFSAAMIERIRKLDRDTVQSAVARNTDESPLLTDEQIGLLFERRDEVIRHVDALIQKNGLEKTLVFP